MVGYEFRMKTGFFETKTFNLLIENKGLIFLSMESDKQQIAIPEKSILNITLKKARESLEMEILTYKKVYSGLLHSKADYEQLLEQLKENINKKIICEYEGGS